MTDSVRSFALATLIAFCMRKMVTMDFSVCTEAHFSRAAGPRMSAMVRLGPLAAFFASEFRDCAHHRLRHGQGKCLKQTLSVIAASSFTIFKQKRRILPN